MAYNLKQSNLLSALSYTAEKVLQLSQENSVLGTPVQQNGVTVIPLSKISIGFAGGGADTLTAAAKQEKHPAGAGGKVSKTPAAVLVLNAQDPAQPVQLLPVTPAESQNLTQSIGTVAGAVGALLKKQRKKGK